LRYLVSVNQAHQLDRRVGYGHWSAPLRIQLNKGPFDARYGFF
jgi:hypothetical protein